MIAGLPGTGIGGIFYMMSAVFMPVREVYMTLRGRSSKKRWSFIATQVTLTLGVFSGFWLTGMFLGWIINFNANAQALVTRAPSNAFNVKPIFISLCVLSAVLLSAEIFSMRFGRRKRKAKSK